MTKERDPDVSGGAVLIFLTLVGWSAVPLFLKYFAAHIDAWTANGWRYGISALFWSPILLLGIRRSFLPARIWRAAIVPSLINIVGQCCFAWSPYYIEPTLLTFMLRFQILFIAIGAYLLFPAERPILRSRMYWIGAMIVLFGSIGTCLFGDGLPRGATAIGIALAIFSGLCFGGYSLSVRYYMEGVRPVHAFAVISLYTACGLVAAMLTLGKQHGAVVMSFNGFQWSMLIISAFVGIALAHVFYYGAIARLGVAVAAGVILLQPFITGIGSYFMFDERLTIVQWISGGLAVGGAVLMLYTQHRLAARASEPCVTATATSPPAMSGTRNPRSSQDACTRKCGAG